MVSGNPSSGTSLFNLSPSLLGEDSPYLSDTGSTATHSTAHSIFPSVPQTVSVAQKKSWFTNLFNFKPASYSLLSVYDPRITRDECRKLLRSFGVGVVLQNSEGPTGGILKCKLDEVRGKLEGDRHIE